MRPIYYTSILALSIFYTFNVNCKISNPKKDSDTIKVLKHDYDSFKNKIQLDKIKLKGMPNKIIKNYIYNLINNDIYQYWKSTPWDFNGTTQQPNKGSIACGYFVTNTLSDIGFKIERHKMAQVASSVMIKKLCVDIKHFTNFEKLTNYLKSQDKNSVYIIGFDYHTGYILNDSNGIYFLHSNYIKREGVVKESIETSEALIHNKTFMIGCLSANQVLISNWLNNK